MGTWATGGKKALRTGLEAYAIEKTRKWNVCKSEEGNQKEMGEKGRQMESEPTG